MRTIKKNLPKQQPINQNSIFIKWETLKFLWGFMHMLWDCYLVWFFCETSSYSGMGGYSEVVTGFSGSSSLLEQASFDIALKRQKVLCSLLHLQTFKHLMKSIISFIFPFPSRQKRNKTWTRTFSPKPFLSISIYGVEILKIWVNFRAIIIIFLILHPSIGNYSYNSLLHSA